MSEPSRNGIELYVVRLKGQVTHRGSITLDRSGLSFKLSALDTRYDPAAVMEGSVGKDGILKVETAMVSEDFGRQAKLRLKPREASGPNVASGDTPAGQSR